MQNLEIISDWAADDTEPINLHIDIQQSQVSYNQPA